MLNNTIPNAEKVERNTGLLTELMGGEKGNLFVNQVFIEEIFGIMTLKAQKRVLKRVNARLEDKIIEWKVAV